MAKKLTAEEIKEIRGKYKLTQQAFARLLGIGEASIVRYESGQEPSKANSNLIRAARSPKFMLGCLQQDGDCLDSIKYSETEKIVYALITLEEDQPMDINETYMLTLEQEVLNEQAAQIMADVWRMKEEAKAQGNEEHERFYQLILDDLAVLKPSIMYSENSTFKKVAELRGRIEGLGHIAAKSGLKAA